MLSSMTGFGRADALAGGRRVSVEIRSVNHRFLEVAARLPRAISALEPRLLESVQQKVSRGKVSVSVSMDGEAEAVAPISVDHAMAGRYLELAREIKESHRLDGEIDLPTLLALPQVLVRSEDEFLEQQAWALLSPALNDALEAFATMRDKEGQALARDLLERIRGIRAAVERVETRVPQVVALVRDRLRERLASIAEDAEYNRYRLEAEMVLFADRSDVTEECVRLRSHCDQFEEFVADPQPTGRRLKFLLEEMHREVNTIGSKGQDTEIARDVLFMKEELERIREQVLNVE